MEKREILFYLMKVCDLIEIKHKLNIIKEDPSDNIVLECAAEGKADYMISGDSHLLGLKEFRGIKILTPKQFVNLRE